MTDWQAEDPNAATEAEKYERPVPSREYILEWLEKRGAPANREQLGAELGIDDDEELVEGLRRRLRAMERDGQLIYTRRGAYAPVDKLDLIRGRVQGHRDGFGFLVPDDASDDLFLSPAQMRQLFDGDRALARVAGFDRRGRREGVVVEVLERAHPVVVGRFFAESGVAYVVPDNPRINHEVLVLAENQGKAKHGQFVQVEILQWPKNHLQAQGKVLEVLGDYMAPGMEIEVALRSYDIPHVWPKEVEVEAAKLAPEVAEKDKAKRIDLRQMPFVTIDGEDARDFDDAVYCEAKKSGGWRLFVAIADVSHYVPVGSALDAEGKNRGNSVYFPERVIPMLPEALSNGLCSLNPLVDRLAMVAEMTISATGKLTGYTFYEAVIHSHARLTYTKVSQVLEKPNSAEGKQLRGQMNHLMPHLKQLYALYQTLLTARAERGAIDFETTETRIVFGADRKIADIRPTQRNDAHKLIEECMLCANVAAAKFLEKHALPALYRVHTSPPEKKLEKLRGFLAELGLVLNKGRGDPTPKDYQALLEAIQDRPDFHLIQTVMLRSLSQACYTAENEGHFGLNYQAYAHFTSPIRRYPDLLVHRAIRSIVRSNVETKHVRRAGAVNIAKARIYPYDEAALEDLGEQCSLTERRADEATRDVVSWLKCEYMQDKVGERFSGVVSAVTGFGLFVELSEIYVEGLVHVTALPGDYYHFDAVHHRLAGERTGRSFRLGDEVEIIVARVDLDERKLDFELAEAAQSVNPKRRREPQANEGSGRGKTGQRRSRQAKGAEPSPELLAEAARQLAERDVKKSRAVRKALLDEAKSQQRHDERTAPKTDSPRPAGKKPAGKKPNKKTSKKSGSKAANKPAAKKANTGAGKAKKPAAPRAGTPRNKARGSA
ncbi:ribonuclease R [Atopomonas sediminilitoris]|uniref:ribonuclease R n=1 Tax=Atopomonas sediminilitoris TaxID=2919919 RepID=UPI001F4D414E|nr:ribonuclease R [Atopomonas sediminilitoris]MCJ8170240.1 ribonuclease R [Atopomonas sediminilitoris]